MERSCMICQSRDNCFNRLSNDCMDCKVSVVFKERQLSLSLTTKKYFFLKMLYLVDLNIVTRRSLICHEIVKSHSKRFIKLHYKKSNSYKGLVGCKMFFSSEARHSRRMCYLPSWIKRDGSIFLLCVCVPEVSHSTIPVRSVFRT